MAVMTVEIICSKCKSEDVGSVQDRRPGVVGRVVLTNSEKFGTGAGSARARAVGAALSHRIAHGFGHGIFTLTKASD